METKQTAESTKTDAQFKIDYNSGKYYEAVSNKLFEISDTLSAMLGCSKYDILNPLTDIVFSVVRSKRAALEKQKQQFEEFHKKGVEKVMKKNKIFKQLHDLLGDDAMYYNQVVNLVAQQHAFNEPENFDLTSCLAEMIYKLDSFIRDTIETGSEKESVKQDTEILKGTKTSEDQESKMSVILVKSGKNFVLKKGKRLKIHGTF